MKLDDHLLTRISELVLPYERETRTNLLDIAKKLGIEVYETDSFPDNKSGSLLKDGGAYKIYVNSSHPETRKRFTIAHEIGHFLAHKDLLEKDGDEHIDDVKQPMPALNRDEAEALSAVDREKEIQANQIAAEILMPENKFKKYLESAFDISEIAKRFGVSESAANFRSQQLTGFSIS